MAKNVLPSRDSKIRISGRFFDMHKYILVIKQLTDCILDDVLLGVGFKFHREMSIGRNFLQNRSFENHEITISENIDKVDIFGNEPATSRNHRAPDCVKCICLECNQPIAAARFAPHLEKCIGMGRNSSRYCGWIQAEVKF